MKTRTRNILIGIAAILLFLGGCFAEKKFGKTCPEPIKITDTLFIVDTDTFNVTKPGKTKTHYFRDSIVITNQAQIDSLLNVYRERERALLAELERLQEIQNALDTLGIGQALIINQPHYDIEGEQLSEDGTAFIKWSITVTDTTAIVKGDTIRPNPRFFVEQNTPVTFKTEPGKGKKNAIGFGFLAGTNGDQINGMPIVKIRLGKTDYYAARDLGGKMWLFGIAKELQFGKQK